MGCIWRMCVGWMSDGGRGKGSEMKGRRDGRRKGRKGGGRGEGTRKSEQKMVDRPLEATKDLEKKEEKERGEGEREGVREKREGVRREGELGREGKGKDEQKGTVQVCRLARSRYVATGGGGGTTRYAAGTSARGVGYFTPGQLHAARGGERSGEKRRYDDGQQRAEQSIGIE